MIMLIIFLTNRELSNFFQLCVKLILKLVSWIFYNEMAFKANRLNTKIFFTQSCNFVATHEKLTNVPIQK